ncbi:MAG: acyl-CoA thioesterase [Muribaculaceae bacterium]|nr:acyl-CoA thioesterase [Muribaculaceae bacterium]
MEFKHKYPAQLRFSDFDMLGHLNNSVYLQIMDLGKVSYFAQATGKTPEPQGTIPVVAHIDIDFDQPTMPGEHITVETATECIGTKSITLRQQIINADNGSVKCRAHVVMVNFDLRTGATAEITDSDRKAISRYEGREL